MTTPPLSPGADFGFDALALLDHAAATGRLVFDENGAVDVASPEDTMARLSQAREQQKAANPDSEDASFPQERIILGVTLQGDGDNSRRWARFRSAVGLAPHQEVPDWVWTSSEHRQVAAEIDAAFRGQRDLRRINGAALIESYRLRCERQQVKGSLQGFARLVQDLQQDAAPACSTNDFLMAVELLKSKRARAALRQLTTRLGYALKADQAVEAVVQGAMEGLEKARDLVRGRLGTEHEFDEVEGLHARLLDRIQRPRTPAISTGVPAFDMDLIGGVKPGQTGKLSLIGARTGVGKTTVAIAAAMGLVLNGASVLFMSCELDGDEVGARALSHYAYHRQLRDCRSWLLEGRGSSTTAPAGFAELPELWRRDREIGAVGNWTSKALFHASAEDFVEFLYAAKAKDPSLSAVFIDHFHAMRPTRGGSSVRSQEMEERALYLHQAAKACQVDLFVLVQLNRDAVLAKAPGLEHINGTDALAQLATAAWLLEFPKRAEGEPFDPTSLICHHAKTRNGQRLFGAVVNVPESHFCVERDHCIISDQATIMAARAQGAPIPEGFYL